MLVNRFEPVEIIIPSGSTLTKFNFPNLPNLTNAKVDRIVLYNAYASNTSILTGNVIAISPQIIQTSITLYQGDLQLYYNLPLTTLVNVASNASQYYNIPIELDGIEISWTKSYISSPIVQADTNTVFSFGIFYHF